MSEPNRTPRFKNMEEYQKWKAERLAQQSQKSIEQQAPGGLSAFCMRCGKQLPANSRYCGHCGASQSSQAPAPPARQPASFKKVMLYTVLGFVGFGILVAIYSNIDRIAPSHPPPASPLQEFAPAVARTNIAHKVENALLDMGIDAHVSVDDSKEGRIILMISGPEYTFDRPFLHRFVSQTDTMNALKEAGFTDVWFSSGADYDLQKGEFKQ